MSGILRVVRVARLQASVAAERDAMGRLCARITAREPTLAAGQASEGAEAVIAVSLHHYYTAVETLLTRIAREVDEDVPHGGSAHKRLLDQLSVEIPGVRPKVLSTQSYAELDALRRFRHFFRHAYVVDLDSVQLAARAAAIRGLHESVCVDIDAWFVVMTAPRDASDAGTDERGGNVG